VRPLRERIDAWRLGHTEPRVVLAMDQDERRLAAFSDALEETGHIVLPSTRAAEALALARDVAALDVVLCWPDDADMSVAAAEICDRWPAARLVYCVPDGTPLPRVDAWTSIRLLVVPSAGDLRPHLAAVLA
jgi:CheY-like chemotaxis protein